MLQLHILWQDRECYKYNRTRSEELTVIVVKLSKFLFLYTTEKNPPIVTNCLYKKSNTRYTYLAEPASCWPLGCARKTVEGWGDRYKWEGGGSRKVRLTCISSSACGHWGLQIPAPHGTEITLIKGIVSRDEYVFWRLIIIIIRYFLYMRCRFLQHFKDP